MSRKNRERRQRNRNNPNRLALQVLTDLEQNKRKVFNWVLADQSERRWERVIEFCETLWLKQLSGASSQAVVSAMDALVQRIFQEGDLETFLVVWERTYGNLPVDKMNNAWLTNLSFGVIDSANLSRVMFLDAYLIHVGKSPDRSLEFALGLTDQWAERTRVSLDIHAVSESTHALEEHLDQLMKADTPEGLNRQYTDGIYSKVVVARSNRVRSFLTGNLDLSECNQESLNTQRWFVNLINAAGCHGAAASVLESVLSVFCVTHSANPLLLFSGDRDTVQSLELLASPLLKGDSLLTDEDLKLFADCEAQMGLTLPQEEKDLIREVILNGFSKSLITELGLVDPEAQPALRRWCAKQYALLKEPISFAERTVAYFRENSIEVEEEMQKRVSQIREGMTRGLRVGGADHFAVRLSALHLAGVRAVIFQPSQDMVLPDTGIEILVKEETPHLSVYRTVLLGGELELHERVVRNKFFPDPENDAPVLQLILKWVIVDMLYRILLKKQELRSLYRRKVNGAPPPNQVPVRPTLRKLVAGTKASDEALERGRLAGFRIPKGKTFVRGFLRGTEIEYDLPTEPIGFYDDDDLRDSGLEFDEIE